MDWLGLDTETHKGKCVLLGLAYDGGVDLYERPRTFADVCEWLCHRGERAVAWNASFDAQAILRLLPRTRYGKALDDLALSNRAEFDGWRVRYIPRKVFELRRGKKQKFALYDAYQFFGRGLSSAARKFLGDDKKQMPQYVADYVHSGLCLYGLQDPQAAPILREYCAHDAVLARRLWYIVWNSLRSLGIPENSPPISPAGIARRYWRAELGRTQHFGQEPRPLHLAAAEAYRGGRIEVLRRGYLPGVHSWDIRSAYPSEMVECHRVASCEMIRDKRIRRDAVYVLVRATIRVTEGDFCPAAMMLPAGGSYLLAYPRGQWTTWLDLHSYWRAEECGAIREVHDAYQWFPTTDDRPYARMRDLYAERARNPGASYGIKLVLNGTYGLLAERCSLYADADSLEDAEFLGGRWRQRFLRNGGSQSLLVAAHVTGAVRARIHRECEHLEVASVMTDGVLARGRPLGDVGPALGQWEDGGACDAVVVGAGIYATAPVGTDPLGGRWSVKSRGWRRLDLMGLLRANPNRSRLPMTTLRASSLREAGLGRASWTAVNDLRDVPRVLDLNFDGKRYWPHKLRARDLLRREYDSAPLIRYA